MTLNYRVLGQLNTIVVLEDKNDLMLPVFWCHIVIRADSLLCIK